MKNKELLRALKFTLFSVSAGIIQALSYTLMNEALGWVHWICNLTAITLSVVWNFTLNRKFTFQSAGNVPVAMLKTALFYLVFIPLTSWGGQALVNLGWNEYLIEGMTMALNFVTEYFYQKYVVFRDALDTAEKENVQ